MALMMTVVGALTTTACVAVAGVPVRWLKVIGRWCAGCCVRCHQSCSRNGGKRRGKRESMTELSNRVMLSRNGDGEAGNYDDMDMRVESKTPSAGSVGSTLATPLLQG